MVQNNQIFEAYHGEDGGRGVKNFKIIAKSTLLCVDFCVLLRNYFKNHEER